MRRYQVTENMFRVVETFLLKRRLKDELQLAFRKIVSHDCLGDLSESRETAVEKAKIRYMELGLTRKEVDSVWSNLGPVNIEV